LVPRSIGFSSRQRLHTSKEFGRVFADPARSSDRYFTVLARPNARDVARLGLTISRRAAKRAVDRNRLKRLAREAFRMQQSLPAWDFVVLAKAGADRADRRLLRESLDGHFERLKAQASARSDA
jgi:ribonuclease P protein component